MAEVERDWFRTGFARGAGLYCTDGDLSAEFNVGAPMLSLG